MFVSYTDIAIPAEPTPSIQRMDLNVSGRIVGVLPLGGDANEMIVRVFFVEGESSTSPGLAPTIPRAVKIGIPDGAGNVEEIMSALGVSQGLPMPNPNVEITERATRTLNLFDAEGDTISAKDDALARQHGQSLQGDDWETADVSFAPARRVHVPTSPTVQRPTVQGGGTLPRPAAPTSRGVAIQERAHRPRHRN